MRKRPGLFLLLGFIMCFSSCIFAYFPQYTSITVVNDTKDSLFYTVNEYETEGDPVRNFAFDTIDPADTNYNRDDIWFNINQQKVFPQDTVYPLIHYSSLKDFAQQAKGLSVLFYKKDIQHLPKGMPLLEKNIFRHIDLSIKQLDSCKYVVHLRD